jgi:Asp-tRNA(Asn)/Glu-tRNA(Gln) amidotransferase A subunit family amidase
MATNLTSLSLVELAALLRAGQVSPVAVVEAYLERIAQINPALNAIVTIAPDVLEQAKRAEAGLAQREVLGPLHGVPITIKDTINTAGIRTTSGSLVRKEHVPAVDAFAVARLKAAGAIILGKTNTPEMAIPYETNNPVFGRTSNPYDPRFTAGGSSGGEAAAIAACMTAGGVGSDLSGSIRVPAHFCGVVGLKPTSGRIPMTGHVPVAAGPLADGACLGPMARVVADVSLLFRVLAASETEEATDVEQLKGLRVCWYDFDGVARVSSETEAAVRAAVAALGVAGLKCVEQRPRAVESGSRLWLELFAETSARDLQELYSGSEDLAGPLARRIMDSAKKRSPQGPNARERALQERNQLRAELLGLMDSTPIIVCPVGATAAFLHESNQVNINGDSVNVFRAFSYAQTFNAFDLPAVVVRAGQTAAGLPVGVQIVGKPFCENQILGVAAIIEAALGGWRPPSNARSNPI